MGRRERRNLGAPAREEHVARDVQGVGAVAHEAGEGGLDLAGGAGVEDPNLQSYGAGGFRQVSQRDEDIENRIGILHSEFTFSV